MKIAIAQINCIVGDLDGNAAKILDYANRAREMGAKVLVTPELSLTGYPPEDLLLREGFYSACDAALFELTRSVEGITLVVGHPHLDNGKRFNSASVLQSGRIVATYHKQRLPNHSVFDEVRYFLPAVKDAFFKWMGFNLVSISVPIFGKRALRSAPVSLVPRCCWC